jgi:hypothetical protein
MYELAITTYQHVQFVETILTTIAIVTGIAMTAFWIVLLAIAIDGDNSIGWPKWIITIALTLICSFSIGLNCTSKYNAEEAVRRVISLEIDQYIDANPEILVPSQQVDGQKQDGTDHIVTSFDLAKYVDGVVDNLIRAIQ